MIDIEKFDQSFIKRDFFKIYHQQGANLDSFDEKVEVIFGENKNYHQIGNAYLQYEIIVEIVEANQADRILIDGDTTRLVNNAFAYCFKETKWSTTGGSDIEHNKYASQVLTIMRSLGTKDGYLLSHFDKSDDSEAQINKTSPKHLRVKNHDVAANNGKIKR